MNPLASEKTLRDEFALQLAAGAAWELAKSNGELIINRMKQIPNAGFARHIYDIADAMVAEKLRRESEERKGAA